jgi:drug/metabolite transporter (DMT)-like permease
MRRTAAPPPDPLAWLLLLALGALWGASFLTGKIALVAIDPLTLAFYRAAGAALALWAIILVVPLPLPRTSCVWRQLLVMGLLNNVLPFALFLWAMTRIDSGLAAILNGATPLLAMVLAHLLLADERLSAGRAIGVLIGMAGLALVVGPGLAAGDDALAELACLGGALAYALAGIWGRRLTGQPLLLVAAGQLGWSALLLAPAAVLFGTPAALLAASRDVLAAIAILALLSTALAYILYFAILRRAGAGNLLLVTLVIPPFALVLGWLILGEIPTAWQLAGLAVVAVALLVVDGRSLPSLRVGRPVAKPS